MTEHVPARGRHTSHSPPRGWRGVAVKWVVTIAITAVLISLHQRIALSADTSAGKFTRAGSICEDIAKIRKMPFKRAVATDVQSSEKFLAYVKDAIAKQFGETGSDYYVRALVKMGVLERPIDLTETFLSVLQNQAAAYYDAESDTYYLLATNAQPYLLDLISSHELCHALQDQHFDLHAFLEEDVVAFRDNGDAALAKQSLVEGEATLVMMVWAIAQHTGMTDIEEAESFATLAAKSQAAMNFDRIMNLAAQNNAAMKSSGWGSLGSIDELRGEPRYFLETLLGSYIQGAAMVDRIRIESGWAAVSALYTNPPQSTEQILHPEKLAGNRDMPQDVRLPQLAQSLPREWKILEEDVLGELGIRIFLDIWQDRESGDPAATATAAGGWDGDRYYYAFRQSTDDDLLVWQTVWDSPRDATEFAIAYRLALSARFPNLKKAWRSAGDAPFVFQVWEVTPDRFLKLVIRKDMIGVIDTTDRAMLDILWK